MLGLGIGSLFGGWLSKRRRHDASTCCAAMIEVVDRRLRALVLVDLRACGRPRTGALAARGGPGNAGAGGGSDPADGCHASPARRLLVPAIRQRWQFGRPSLLCQHAGRRRGLPGLRGAAVSRARHGGLGTGRGGVQRCGRARGGRRPLDRSSPPWRRHGERRRSPDCRCRLRQFVLRHRARDVLRQRPCIAIV